MNGMALCAGIGGLELGLKLAMGEQYRAICYVERDAFAAALLVARMEEKVMDQAPIWDDLATFDGRPWRGTVDLISAGFPCQPFSSAGNRRGVDDERWLWPEIARIIRDVGPSLIFFENVPGIVRHGLRVVWSDLRRMGFRIQAGLFSAHEIGAPHLRRRFFALAYTDGQRLLRLGLEKHARIESAHGDLALRCRDDRELDERTLTPWPQGRHESRWPEGLEPGVRRVAHGIPDRMDRIRALGNAVVPMVAAHAFRALAREVTG